jgi:hypothetical protein
MRCRVTREDEAELTADEVDDVLSMGGRAIGGDLGLADKRDEGLEGGGLILGEGGAPIMV